MEVGNRVAYTGKLSADDLANAVGTIVGIDDHVRVKWDAPHTKYGFGCKKENLTVVPSGALSVQVGGIHYKKMGIQPVQYIHANKLSFFEGCIVKYISRWRDKGGKADLEKIKHFVDLIIELEKL